MTLRLIQIGMGGWGRDWTAHVLRGAPDVTLVGYVDSDPSALELARTTLNLPPRRLHATVEAALRTADADAALITASLPGHVPLATAALDAGLHVLIEKPFAPTVEEGRHLVDHAARRGLALMVSQNYRFFPAVRVAAALVREASLGTVGSVAIDFRRNVRDDTPVTRRHYALVHPLLLDMAIHHFDLMRLVIGQEPREVTCHAWNPPWSKYADPAAAALTITFDGGAVVSYRGSWVSPLPKTHWAGQWRMECAGGEISWTSRGGADASADRVTVRPLGRPPRRVELPALPAIDRAGALAAFVAAVRAGREPESSGRENLGTLALAAAAIAAASTGRPQEIAV